MYDELLKSLREQVKCDKKLYPQGVPIETLLLDLAADAIEELSVVVRAQRTVLDKFPRWIPVTERLPEQGKRYLVIRFDEVTKTQFIDILWHDAHDLWWNRLYKGQYNVTHWMPLPEPPKEER